MNPFFGEKKMNLQEADDVADKIAKRLLTAVNQIAAQLGEKEEADPAKFFDDMPLEEKIIFRKILQQCAGVLSSDTDFTLLGMWARGEHE